MYDVITVGSATVDVFAKTRFSELIKIIDPKGETDFLAFPSGAKILIDEIEFSTGGGGTNTAVALARLGHKTAFIGKLGKGTNSEFIHKNLVKEKVDLLCSHGDGDAGYSVILDTLEHDRTILAYKGINDQLKSKDIPYGKLKAKWFYFSSMMNESFGTLEMLAVFAGKHNIKFAFNPSEYLAEKGSRYLKNILENAEVLILNKEEAVLLAGKSDVEDLLHNLKKLGPKIVVITDGKNKLFAADSKYIYSARPPAVKVVDATGAGDAFAATFLSGLMRKNDIEHAIKLGIANSLSVITHYGAKNILLSQKEILRNMKKYKIKVSKKRI